MKRDSGWWKRHIWFLYAAIQWFTWLQQLTGDPEEILFLWLVYIIDLITIVENAWSYLSVIALISKTPSDTSREFGHPLHQSCSVCGLGITLGQCDFKKVPVRGHGDGNNKYSEVITDMQSGPLRNRCDTGKDTAPRETTQQVISVD